MGLLNFYTLTSKLVQEESMESVEIFHGVESSYDTRLVCYDEKEKMFPQPLQSFYYSWQKLQILYPINVTAILN